jgi:hypothetical protein
MAPRREPDALAQFLAHTLVGGLAVYLFGRGRGSAEALAIGIIGITAHAALDAPVAQSLSDLGI